MAICIGLDPGVKTGLAVWDTEARAFQDIRTTTIIDAMRIILLLDAKTAEPNVTLYAEDARQRKWIPRERSLSQFKGRAMGAGSVKRDCAIWEEFARHYGIPIVLLPPRKGLTKWDADTFARMTGWKGRTSNHARDAALLVFGKSNTKNQ